MEIIANGRRYDVHNNGYIYLDKRRVSKDAMMADLQEDIRPTRIHNDTTQNEVLERAEERPFNKGPNMTYEEKLEAFGLDREALERKVGKTAYKPGNYDEMTGKQYMGSYLCNINGKAKIIGETTFKGNLQITDVNLKSVGFYMPELFNIASFKRQSEFESIRPGSISLDDLGTFDDATQVVDVITVYRVTFADLDLITFHNETTNQFMGTKLYQVYAAEQQARLKKPSMDDLFDNLKSKDIKDCNEELGEDKQTA